MRKRKELADSRSCLSKALDDEMIFVLLGRDAAAVETIRFWVSERIRLGKNQAGDAQVEEAMECAGVMAQDTHDWDQESGGGFSEPPQCRKCGMVARENMPCCPMLERRIGAKP